MSSTGTVRSWGERLRAVAVRLAVTGGLTATAWLAVATAASADEAPARVVVLSPSVVLEQGQRPADAATPAGALVDQAAVSNAARLRAAKLAERPAPAAVRTTAGADHADLRDLIRDLLRIRLTPSGPAPGEDPDAGLTRPLPEPDPGAPNLLPAGPERPPLGDHSSGEVSAERPKPLPWPEPDPVTLPAPDTPPAQAPADEANARHGHHASVRQAPGRSSLSLGGTGDAKKDGVPTLPHEDSKKSPVQTGTSPAGNGLAEGGPHRTAAGLPALLPPPPVLSVTGVVYGDGVVPVAGFLSRPATSPD
ncbi:hypothetical protein NLX83_07295 [Allokutzneria sp. A3M-2-11 16]|uniref:hypothetical protein n=1 Tax=Allokutzneria sp. A3M-2-11 16 TaxID=2962043 RepID=UPI0020B7BE5F|nr:hypothetical protein [Allokutzneria sp. A3M-2-11 16]MCP3799059.1 hypothetical protein [Allokutzneria sp. A3M-2-11 16]